MTSTADDPYLSALYDSLHATPMQRRLRRMAPMPVGCVFLPWPDMTEADARGHFRLMKELGFTCLKQTMPTPEWPTHRTLSLALEEGISPFWYAEGGWEEITPDLLEKLGLPPDLSIEEAMAHPAVHVHQMRVLQNRVDRDVKPLDISGGAGPKRTREDAQKVPGVVGDIQGHELHPDAVPHFIGWLQREYGSVEAVKEAWNWRHVGICQNGLRWETWDDVREGFLTDIPDQEFRHLRDILRFRADMFIRDYITSTVDAKKSDPNEPVRAGGEMGLFLPFASRGTDMEGVAKAIAEGGSFYPSIHPAWHFEEVGFELARPVYMQAQITADWAKGVWTATWESTGGPQYFSGGKSPFVAEVRDQTAGFTVDEGVITQLMLSYLAAGFRGFGLWTWNGRTAGWEAGEFALLDRNNHVTPRAIRAGAIGKAACKWRRELWQARKEPMVGIMVDWENEVIWAAMAVTGRDKFKTEPVRARIGASRALINANIPWEYVTPANLFAGLGPRYGAIYMPASIAVREELQNSLIEYVNGGGRLLLDMPGWYMDGYGRLLPTGEGSLFETLFGAVLNEYSYSSPNTPYRIGAVALEGFTASITPTRAKILATYHNGRAAVTEAHIGAGSALLLGAQLSLSTWKPGNPDLERLIVDHSLGGRVATYSCDSALAYRLAAPAADHYFLINDGPERLAQLDTRDYSYTSISDAITGDILRRGEALSIEAHSGRWIRCEK